VTRATAVVCLLVSSCAVIAGLDEKRLTPQPASEGSAGVGLGGVGGSAAGTSGGQAGSDDAGATAAGTGAGLGGSAGVAGRGGSGATGGKGGGSGTGGKGGGGGVAGSTVGGNGGNPPTAGIGGGGMTGTAGTGGSNAAGATSEPFPSYGVLDDFNRPGPEVGTNWIGAVTAYSVSDEQLDCVGNYCAGTFWHEKFGAVQEAFVTLAYFDLEAQESNLVIKAQGDKDCDLMEIAYLPWMGRVEVIACAGGFYSLGSVQVSFAPGDQLGARARADGFIEVFKNGSRIGLFDANSYPFIDQSGYIGVNGFTGTGVTSNGWDDFGGGGE
jgi:hypothetical protein